VLSITLDCRWLLFVLKLCSPIHLLFAWIGLGPAPLQSKSQ